jgi:hypothetical protein
VTAKNKKPGDNGLIVVGRIAVHFGWAVPWLSAMRAGVSHEKCKFQSGRSLPISRYVNLNTEALFRSAVIQSSVFKGHRSIKSTGSERARRAQPGLWDPNGILSSMRADVLPVVFKGAIVVGTGFRTQQFG